MKARSLSYYPKAVYYRENFTENGKSKSKWVKIEGLEYDPGHAPEFQEIIISTEGGFAPRLWKKKSFQRSGRDTYVQE